MIISAAPFRVSFAGGGSDLPGYCARRKGAVLSVSINKFVYISIHPYFHRQQTLLKYSRNELVECVDGIAHPIFREALKELCPEGGVEIVSTADVPAGTGLGSSSSFTVALLHALCAYRATSCSKESLARKACEIEIDRLGEPIGRQDQYAASYGGLNLLEFNGDGSVAVSPLTLSAGAAAALQRRLHLYYMGDQRDTSRILHDQAGQVAASEERFENVGHMVSLAYAMRDRLAAGDLDGFGRDLHDGWLLKRSLSPMISTPDIDERYQRALDAGATGGKLLGAGGGGFLLVHCTTDRHDAVSRALPDCFEMPFAFESDGARIIYTGERDTEHGFVR